MLGLSTARDQQEPANLANSRLTSPPPALTYGPDTDWVKNVLAAGGCELRTHGRAIKLSSPRLYHDESRRDIRTLERQVLRIIGVADFLSLKTASAPG